MMPLTVTTERSLLGDDEPRDFLLGSSVLSVTEILDRWLSTAQNYYKVLASDGNLYILREDGDSHLWQLTLYQQTHAST